jgi:Ubiquitin family
VSAQYISAEDIAAHLQGLDVESSDSIENVKQKIQDTQAIPPAQMILQYNGMIMLDGRTLADYHVVPASTINFFVTPVIVSIVPGETTLTVTWDSPVGTTDNYGQNSGFIATTFGNLSCTAVATTCTIEHAQSSTTYFVTVASTNSTGPNVPSPSLSATTLAATPTTTTTTTPPALPLVPEHSLASTGSATTELFLGGTVLVLLGALLARVTVSIQRRSTR